MCARRFAALGLPSAATTALAFFFCMGGLTSTAHASGSTSPTEVELVRSIQNYCTSSWRNAHLPSTEWPDSTQQVLVELLQKISRTQLPEAMANPRSRERRELNRAIWRVLKRWLRRVRWVSLGETDCADPATCEPHVSRENRLESVLAAAAVRLSPRQMRILLLFRDGFSINEIARQLSTSPARVSDEKYRALRCLRHHVAAGRPSLKDD